MSNGYWCCSETDGDAWFGDTYFDIAKWKRGLEYMVKHVSYHFSIHLELTTQLLRAHLGAT